MKKIFVLIALLISIQVVSATEIYSADQLDMTLNVGSGVTLEKESSNSRVEYVKIFLSFYPKENFQQTVHNIDTIPSAKENVDSLVYSWDDPQESRLDFSLASDITVKNRRIPIRRKIRFPLHEEDTEGYEEYTLGTDMIDSGIQSIIDKSSEIAEGEDDQYEVVFKLAKWVRTNIKYDLNTLTAESVQKSSWVLFNRQGVCDEITNLFIAMCRALGIPTRYVSGMAYTNYGGLNDWGPHAWAEVYFPEYGWVPFDITYGQFGYVDPSHIPLKYSFDPNEPSTNYEWRGINTNLKTKKLDLDVSLQNSQGKAPELFRFDTKLVKNNIGFGSYNVVEVEVENLVDYYVATELLISKPEEVEVIGENKKHILLKPEEKKKIYWTIRIDSGLNQDFVYTLPVAVFTQRNTTSRADCKASYRDTVYSREEVENLVDTEIEEKTYKSRISMLCSPERKVMIAEESQEISCIVKNTGNTILQNVLVCMGEKCLKKDIKINQEENILFNYTPDSIGKKSILMTAKTPTVSISDTVIIDSIDKPEIIIRNISYPSSVSFDQAYQLSFTLDKKSFVDPQDVEIVVEINNLEEKWNIKSLNQNRKININLKANNLDEGENDIKISVSYKDDKGNTFSANENLKINLAEVTFFQKIQIWFNKTGAWLQSLFNK